MSDEQDTTPVEVSAVKVVDFYGDQITAAQGADGDIYVPLRPLTNFLGLGYGSQYNRVRRDPVLAKRVRTIQLETAGGPQRVSCLPLDLLPGWLFGIATTRVSPALQDKLNRYREECFKALWRAFQPSITGQVQPPTNLTPAEQILAQAQAIAALAQQQVDFERGLAEAQSKQQTMADYMRGFVKDTRQGLRDHEQRLSALELRVEPSSETITEQQAAEIALAVKNVGILLTGIKGSNGYSQVYGELYRRYGVGAYRNLKRSDYEDVLKWLKDWHQELFDKLGE